MSYLMGNDPEIDSILESLGIAIDPQEVGEIVIRIPVDEAVTVEIEHLVGRNSLEPAAITDRYRLVKIDAPPSIAPES